MVEDSTLRQDRRVSGVICLEHWGLFFALIILYAGMLRRRCALAVAMGGFFKRKGRQYGGLITFAFNMLDVNMIGSREPKTSFSCHLRRTSSRSLATSDLFLESSALAVKVHVILKTDFHVIISHAGLMSEAKIRRPRRGGDGR
jgi:hypothetical protein